MMNKLMINGTQTIQGKKVKVIEGGFGEGQKCMLASDIAKQHGVKIEYINKLINVNISRFNRNDLVNLKTDSYKECVLEMGFTSAQWGNAKNIFLLSERGYTKLVSMMSNDNEKKWEVMDKLIDGYFNMREKLNNANNLQNEEIHSLLNEMKAQVNESRIQLDEAKEYYKINAKTVNRYSQYIKNRLGIKKTNKEYYQVIEMLFARLEIEKWEDIKISDKCKLFDLIDTCISNAKRERPYEQLYMFE